MDSYRDNFKKIAENLILVYKNFIHWNLSKLAIFLYSLLSGLILSLPLLILGGFLVGNIGEQLNALKSPSGLDINNFIFQLIVQNFGSFVLGFIAFMIVIAIFSFTFMYGYFLLQNVYKHYLIGEKLPFTKNLYFSWGHMWAYVKVLWWVSLYLLIPIAILLIGALIILWLVWWGVIDIATERNLYILWGLSLPVFLAAFIYFIYLGIRLAFSYISLLYDENIQKNCKTYVEKSFELTKWKVWKIILLTLPFIILFGIVEGIFNTVDSGLQTSRIEKSIQEVIAKSPELYQDDHSYLSKYTSPDNEAELQAIETINARYAKETNSINRDYLGDMMPYLDTARLDPDSWIYATLFGLILFFLTEGIMYMVYITIYHILLKNK